jgi:hypothetical protein
MYVRNGKGPSIEPCGTLCLTMPVLVKYIQVYSAEHLPG